MNANNASLRPSSRRLRRAARAAFLPLLVAGAIAGTSVAGEREASASVGSSLAGQFIKNGVGCVASGRTADFGTCLLGADPDNSLSATDLESIKDVVTAALVAHGLNVEEANAKGVISNAAGYYRNSAVSLANLHESYGTATKIHDAAEAVMNQLAIYDLEGAHSYRILGMIRHAMAVEMYNIQIAKIELNVEPGEISVPTPQDLENFRTEIIMPEAAEVAVTLSTWSDSINAAHGELTHTMSEDFKSGKDECYSIIPYNASESYRDITSKFCFNDPTKSSGKTCFSYEYWKCDGSPGDNYSHSKDRQTYATASIALQNAKIAYRDAKLGGLAYEAIHEFTQAAAGDYEYCGNGVCALGEISTCQTDCAETSSTMGNFDQRTGTGSWTTSGPTTLLETDAASLEWQDNGNLVLWSANDKVIWASYTHNVADGLAFKTNGDLMLSTSGTSVWNTKTTASNFGQKATKMVLVGEVFHLLNDDGDSLWNSETDWHRHSSGYTNTSIAFEGEDGARFCIPAPTDANRTLLTTGDFGSTSTYRLDWKTNGNLALYDSSDNVEWHSHTVGTGAYLCNQEDGSLNIYDDEYYEVWSSRTTSALGGSQLQLVRDQLRMTAPSGDIMWVSGECSQQDCKYAVQKLSSFSKTKTTSNQTLLETGKAKLVFASDGRLKILRKSDGGTLWQSSYSSDNASFSNGLLSVGGIPVSIFTGSKLFLVDCNLFIGDSSTNAPVFTTETTCD